MPAPASLAAYDEDGKEYVVPLVNVAGIYQDEDDPSRTFVRLVAPIGSLGGLYINAPLARVKRDLGAYVGRGR